MPENNSSNIDIFGMLSDDSEEKKKSQREELLSATGVKEFFEEGDIRIDKRTCWGLECKLCIDACPTNALFWQSGEVKIIKDLCVYCGACVLCCMVDDCIKIKRKRENGKIEKFSKPKDVIKLEERINTKKRVERVTGLFPSVDRYCEKYQKQKK
jgi:Na+-translocating ferredoxin:NAD+ oxidoreductase RNF subunit RnfB